MTQEEQLLDSNFTKKADFKEFEFPMTFEFKIGSLANDFTAKDASGRSSAVAEERTATSGF